MCAQLLSHGWLFETPWTTDLRFLLSIEFSRQEYWIRMLFPTPGDLPNPGTELSPALVGRFFTTEQYGKSIITSYLKTILLHISKIRYYCFVCVCVCVCVCVYAHKKIRKVKWYVKYHTINFWFEQYQHLSLLILLLSHRLLKACTILKNLWRLVYESYTMFGSKIIFFQLHILDVII